MNKLLRCLSVALLGVILLCLPVYAERNEVNVIIDGAGVDIETLLENHRTFVPAKTLGEKLNFNPADFRKEIKIIEDNETWLPLRLVAESMGKEVQWDGNNHNVLIGKLNQEVIPEDTFIYVNEEYGYTLNFPNSWKNV